MNKWFILLLLLLIPATLLAQEQIYPSTFHYVKLLLGAESNVVKGISGTLWDEHGVKIGSLLVIDANDLNSIAKVSLREGDLLKDLYRISLDELDLDEVNFSLEDKQKYFTLKQGSNEGIKKGNKGKLMSGDQLVGFFRVISADQTESTIFVFSVAANMDFKEARTAVFQNYFEQIITTTGFANLDFKNLIMILVGIIFIYLAIAKDYEPLLLIPIGFGILIGNIPLPVQIFNSISVYMIDPITHQYTFNTTSNSVFGIIYQLVTSGMLPPLIFLGIGAMTDFTAMLSNPKTVLLGAAAQFGVFSTFLGALWLGFSPAAAASIGIIGGADGPTAIFLTSQLFPSLIGPIAIAAYSYMGLIPIIQPPIMKLLTTKKERVIRMKAGRRVGKVEKIAFPIVGFLVTTFIAPGAIPLLGMLFFGNLLKESGVTARLAKTASNALIDTCTILLGVGVGASTTAQVFLNSKSIFIFVLGCVAFISASAIGVLFAKFMNLFLKEGNKINPLIGSAGVSAVPDAARVSEMVGREFDPNNHLLMHAMGPNVAGVIGSAIAAGILLGIF